MPRYFFHRTDGFVEIDDEGVELAGADMARAEAVMFAGASLKDDPNQVWSGQDFRVEVTDEQGNLLFTIITLAVDASRIKQQATSRPAPSASRASSAPP